MHKPASLIEAAVQVLSEPDTDTKAQLTEQHAAAWQSGCLPLDTGSASLVPVPDKPARHAAKVLLVPPYKARRLGKGGSLASRIAIIHSLVHIEGWAVDLSWDAVARFGQQAQEYSLPRSFFDDFVQVAADEGRHYTALQQRLQNLGSHYGALEAHDGLWDSAAQTAHSLPARLAVEHCVHEARGLDVLPQTIERFESNGDPETAALLRDVVYPEEITHCAAGVRWLQHLHAVAQQDRSPQHAAPAWQAAASSQATVHGWFQQLIRTHFAGSLKPPFNQWARAQAGFTQDWYMPLAETQAARTARLQGKASRMHDDLTGRSCTGVQ